MDTSEEAKDIIRRLPLDATDYATGVWVEGSSSALGAVRALCAQITIVSGRVGEFERGHFDILSKAEEKVKDISDACILAILDDTGNITVAHLDYD